MGHSDHVVENVPDVGTYINAQAATSQVRRDEQSDVLDVFAVTLEPAGSSDRSPAPLPGAPSKQRRCRVTHIVARVDHGHVDSRACGLGPVVD